MLKLDQSKSTRIVEPKTIYNTNYEDIDNKLMLYILLFMQQLTFRKKSYVL